MNEGYLYWLERADLDNASLSDLHRAVSGALIELGSPSENPEVEAACSALEEILEHLISGSVPTFELNEFRQSFLNGTHTVLPTHQHLEEELRSIASGLAHEIWKTASYIQFETAIEAYRVDKQQEEGLWNTIDALSDLIDQAMTTYEATLILPKEVTMESQLTHTLLLEGSALWRQAFDMLENDEEDHDLHLDNALSLAQEANRLLVAISIYHSRLQAMRLP